MTNISDKLHSAALEYAAEQLEATGEHGTLDAIVILGQLAATPGPNDLQMIPILRDNKTYERLMIPFPVAFQVKAPISAHDQRQAIPKIPAPTLVHMDRTVGEALGFTCSTCADTHRMQIGDREVMCTRCPTPCQSCRSANGRGSYCEAAPCACKCHALKLAGGAVIPAPARMWKCELEFAGGDGVVLSPVRAADVREALEHFCRHPRYIEAVRVLLNGHEVLA